MEALTSRNDLSTLSFTLWLLIEEDSSSGRRISIELRQRGCGRIRESRCFLIPDQTPPLDDPVSLQQDAEETANRTNGARKVRFQRMDELWFRPNEEFKIGRMLTILKCSSRTETKIGDLRK